MKLIKPMINVKVLGAATTVPKEFKYTNEELLSFDPQAKFLPEFARKKLASSILKKFGFSSRYMVS